MIGLRYIVTATLLVSVLGSTAWAQSASARKAALVLRILSYDRNLRQRTNDQVTVILVYKSGNRASEVERRALGSALDALGRRTTVAGMPVRTVAVAYAGQEDLERRARSERAAAVYVCEGLLDVAREISSAATARRMLAMTGERAGLDHGLGLGIVTSGSEVSLFVNLPATQAQGARLDAALLRLAQVIR